ncbi:MAG TPA: hypothetical protein PK777_00980, partial [Thermoguttaceae bacterium]|nr:hypothetical protein [Thermoguttaceae bacterium]
MMQRYFSLGESRFAGAVFMVMGLFLWAGGGLTALGAHREVIDPEEAAKDPDFAFQGEYLGEGKPA